ncbi:MAG: nucleotidyltransferase domain-containing protein, partial [Candidatus Woesearchaeota archaeon]
MNIQDILTEQRNKITVTDVQKQKAEHFLNLLRKSISVLNIDAVVQLGGSLAKNTFLPDDFDADVFVRFAPSYPDTELSKLLQNIVKELNIPFDIVHGSRDYVQLTYDDLAYEIIPVCRIDSPESARNVTDMSYMHVDWVNAHTKNTSLCEEIRLTKVFCKAQRVYGAESYIGGFSGHIIDILVIYYGGFLTLLEASQTWTSNYVIDPENYYGGKEP